MKWIAALLLILSVALKVATITSFPVDRPDVAAQRAADSMTAAGYAVDHVPRMPQGLVARQGHCRFRIRVLDPHMTSREAYQVSLAKFGQVRLAQGGAWVDEASRLRVLAEFFLKREIARQGVSVERSAVWMVSIPAGCPPPEPGLFAGPVPIIKSPI